MECRDERLRGFVVFLWNIWGSGSLVFIEMHILCSNLWNVFFCVISKQKNRFLRPVFTFRSNFMQKLITDLWSHLHKSITKNHISYKKFAVKSRDASWILKTFLSPSGYRELLCTRNKMMPRAKKASIKWLRKRMRDQKCTPKRWRGPKKIPTSRDFLFSFFLD